MGYHTSKSSGLEISLALLQGSLLINKEIMFGVLSSPLPYYFADALEKNRLVQHIYVISWGFVFYDEWYHINHLLDFKSRVSKLFTTSAQIDIDSYYMVHLIMINKHS